jgi:hypothetical protein
MSQSEHMDVHMELYRFDCPRCGAGWTVAFQVRELTGPEGEEIELYMVDGTPVPSPRVGVTCPSCGYDPVRGRPAGQAPEHPPPPPPGRAHAIGGLPLIVTGTHHFDRGGVRVRLGLGRTRLELWHGPGPMPEDVRQVLQAPVLVAVGGVDALFDAGHWAEPRSRLVWERDGRWFQLLGLAERELLVRVANALADDLPRLFGRG